MSNFKLKNKVYGKECVNSLLQSAIRSIQYTGSLSLLKRIVNLAACKKSKGKDYI